MKLKLLMKKNIMILIKKLNFFINRNGSKEAIDEYLEQTKAQAVESEALLRSILGYLNLQPLPPLQGKL